MVIEVSKALDGTFVEYTIRDLDVEDVIPEMGLDNVLQIPSQIISQALKRRNCFKFYLKCEALLQVV